MVSTKPYLVRAIFEWCVDQGLTPYISVMVGPGTRVPREFVRDGQIVLNIGPDATNQLMIGNEEITFQARFNAVAFPVIVPIDAVAAIYAKENGQGIGFDVVPVSDSGAVPEVGTDAIDDSGEGGQSRSPPGGRPHLTRVK